MENNTTSVMEELSAVQIWVLVGFFSAILLATLIINSALLELIAVALRHRLRYPRMRHFLGSLACVNLISSLVLLPIWLHALVSSEINDPGKLTKEISEFYYYSFDVFYGFLTILHIILLMTERLFAVGWPIHHRIAPDMPDYVICVGIWFAAVLVSTASFLVHHYSTFKELSLVILTAFFASPTLVAIVLFASILAKSNRRNRTASLQRDFSLSVVIAIMLGVYMITFLPLHCVNYLSFSCSSCGQITNHYFVVTMSLRCLQYSGGIVLPIVVLTGVAEFRDKLAWCRFQCCSVNEDNNNDLYHLEVPGMLRATMSTQCMLTRVNPSDTGSPKQLQLGVHEQAIEAE